jgi:hypothetical protein
MFRRSVALACILTLSATSAGAVSLIPIGDDPGGQSAAASAANWLQWVSSFDRIADGGDPLTDDTGASQNKKQTFPVQMLGGSVVGDVERSFTVRADRPLMIPLAIDACVGGLASAPFPGNVPCEGGDQAFARDRQDNVDRLFLKIDGDVLLDLATTDEVDTVESAFRIESDLFAVDLAPNNVFDVFFDAPPGIYPSSFSYGFFAFTALGLGQHVVEYGGGTGGASFVTATIEVVPIPATLPLLVAGFGGLVLAARKRRTAG